MNRKSQFAGIPHFSLIPLTILLITVAAGGGSARADVTSLLYVRPIVAGLLAWLVASGAWRAKVVRAPLLMLSALIVWMVLQLIPLPPSAWTSLPGRALFTLADTVDGTDTSWRALSVAPDLTLNSLLSTLLPASALLAAGTIDRDRQRYAVSALLVVVGASAVLGILQISSGMQSPFYLYRISHHDTATGLFANRNHAATLLAVGIPVAAAWAIAASGAQHRRSQRWPVVAALVIALLLSAMIVVTGSRAGLVLGGIGIFAGGAILWRRREMLGPRMGARQKTAAIGGTLILLAIVVTVAWQRDLAFERAGDLAALGSEKRLTLLPTVLKLGRDFLPFGSGFGTFDPVFRTAEPNWALGLTYFNHAHNDFLELVVTGGLPALAILAIFLVWWLRATLRAVAAPPGATAARAQAGSAIVAILLSASIVDYPVRTPLLAVIMAVACTWLAAPADAKAGAKLPMA